MKTNPTLSCMLAMTILFGSAFKASATGEVGDGVSDKWIEVQGQATAEWYNSQKPLGSIGEALKGFKRFVKVVGYVKQDPKQKCEVTVARKNSFETPFYYFSVFFQASASIQTAYMIEPTDLDQLESYSFQNESNGLSASFGHNYRDRTNIVNYQTTTLSLDKKTNSFEIEINVTSDADEYSVSSTPGACVIKKSKLF